MKNTVRVVGLGALCTSAALYACGDDSTTPNGVGLPDASGIDGSRADSASPDGGGGDAAPSDSATPDAPATDAAPEAAPWCGNERDGGALCATGQWRNFGPPDAGDAGTCNACPTAPLTCATALVTLIDGGPSFTLPNYNNATDTLTVTLPPGQLEVLSITSATAVISSNCFGGPGANVTGPLTVPATVNGDTVSFDFSGAPDAGANPAPCGLITFTVKDACCTTSNVTVNAYYDSEAARITGGSCPDGG